MKNTKVINLFAGPGAGKSTIRAQVFAELKWRQYLVEEAPEFAKDLVWEKRHYSLSDQIYVFAKQWHRIERLRGQVDYVVTDSPVPMCHVYAARCDRVLPLAFNVLVQHTYESMENLNFFLRRTKPYSAIGRNQTEEQARILDEEIEQMLKEWNIPCTKVLADQNAHLAIINLLKG